MSFSSCGDGSEGCEDERDDEEGEEDEKDEERDRREEGGGVAGVEEEESSSEPTDVTPFVSVFPSSEFSGEEEEEGEGVVSLCLEGGG